VTIAAKYHFSEENISRIIEMAWEDRTTFEAIELEYNIPEKDATHLMQQEMKLSSWKMWRIRVNSRTTKHLKKRGFRMSRFKSKNQR
jgi:uncharacterized protein (TIGR03643 family)